MSTTPIAAIPSIPTSESPSVYTLQNGSILGHYPEQAGYTNPDNVELGRGNESGVPCYSKALSNAQVAWGFYGYPTTNINTLKLSINSTVANSVGSTTTCSIIYSLDGGNSWYSVYTGQTSRGQTTDVINLSPTQDLNKVIVCANTQYADNGTQHNIYFIVIDVVPFQDQSQQPPFPPQAEIGALVQGVANKLGNRTDLNTRIAFWIQAAILEFTQAYDFEELVVTGPLDKTFQLNINQYSYNYFLNEGDVLTRISSWYVGTQPAVAINSGQASGFQMKYASPAVVEQIAQIPGMPIKYSRVGAYYLVGPMPNNTYPSFMRYQKQHPYSLDPVICPSIPIQMPFDWLEILEYSAAERGAAEERMQDYVSLYHNILYGDPEFQKTGTAGEGMPGLIHRRISQRTRDMSKNERSLKPVVQRY